MKDVITLLPDSVANQIAAGEVIQRPASVIKELMENSVDAGATKIDVIVSEAGRELIQVIDNGKGMSEIDARLSFERHATSKIRNASDLFQLTTMGFRGEALASISAVAQVELKTKMSDEELGTKVVIEGSKVLSQEPISCPTGSNFLIKNLFYNVPARRKFLKSDSTEMRNIITEFEKIALVNPNISFSLHNNDTVVYDLQSSSLRHRILSIFGKKIGQHLLEVDVKTTIVRIKGYVANPELARKKGYHQYFFINGRYMKHPYFHRAISDAYQQIIPQGEQISYFLYLDVDPSTIDVNIHPTKTEIKFENEQSIWQIMLSAVKETLGKHSIMPSIDFDTQDMIDIPPMVETKNFDPPKIEYDESYNPFKNNFSGYSSGYSSKKTNVDWESIYGNIPSKKIVGDDSVSLNDLDILEIPEERSNQLSIYKDSDIEPSFANFHFKNKYILTNVKSGLMLIDQHRAHIRILYEAYLYNIVNSKGISQKILFPELVELTQAEAVMLESLEEEFSSLGFEISHLGGGSFSISAVPSNLNDIDPVSVIKQMIADAYDKGSDVKEELQSTISLSLARSSAIHYGKSLSEQEMQDVINKLFSLKDPTYTPDGKKILITMKEEEIDKMFK